MDAKRRRPLMGNVLWGAALVAVLAVGYVLSYAPAVKWKATQTGIAGIDGRVLAVYGRADCCGQMR